MPLTPEQKEAWEREKAQREARSLQEQEALQKRQTEQAKIDQAIREVEKKERNRKLLIGLGIILYMSAVIWYFFLR